jgi:Ca2+-binding EF-hand superfamily protein
MRLLSIASCLALALTACKDAPDKASDPGSSQASSGGAATETSPRGRSGKIDLPPRRPRPPTLDAQPETRRPSARAAAGRDGQLSDEERRARREARREARMARLDTDGDGQISDAEREAARQAREAERLARLDTDGDGQISDEERAAARTVRTESMHARLDRDGDGVVTVDELGAMPWLRGGASALDTDGDGKITIEELQAGMAERRGRAGRRGPRRGE